MIRPLRQLVLAVFLACTLWCQAQPLCTITKYDEDAGMAQWRVTQMLQDDNGLLWFSTWNGLDRFDGYEFTNFKSRAGDGCDMPSDRIRDLRKWSDGNLYCKVEDSWFLFNRQTGTFSKSALTDKDWGRLKNNGRQTVGSIDKEVVWTDPYGVSWRIDAAGRLFYRHDGVEEPFPTTEFLTDIQFYMSDRQGNLWLLTHHGVFKLSFIRRPAKAFPQEQAAQTGALMLDHEQHYWITTKADRTVRLFDSQNRLLGYLSPDGRLLPQYVSFGSSVYALYESRSGSVWMGSKPDGLFQLKAASAEANRFIDHLEAFSHRSVYSIQEDAHGRIWVATMGDGISCIVNPELGNSSKIIHFIGKSGYPKMKENRVRFLYITQDQLLLAATTEGLLVGKIPDGDVSTMTFRLHTKEPDRESSLSCNATMDILEMDSGKIFVSTESGGVNEIVSNNLLSEQLDFRHYNIQNGLNSDVALALARLDDSHLLIVSSNQLMTLDISNGEFSYFDAHFFHQPYRFSEVRPIRLPDGRWLFGLSDGAITISDQLIEKSHYVPPVVLTGVSVAGKPLLTTVDHLQVLTLQPDERSVTIYFAAPDYSDPSKVKYAFKMSDDESWNFVGKNHTASFADMQPGTYQLLIRSTNADGVWVDNTRMLTIVVKPKFHESLFGRLLILLLLLSLIAIAGYTYLYIRRIKLQQHETLEAYLALVAENTRNENAIGGVPVCDTGNSSPSPVEPSAEPPSPLTSEEDRAFMSRVMAFVEAHIGDADATIADMADATATSRSGLNRKMKSLVGLTPADFLREARVKRACQLLTTTDSPVSDIAYRVGFTDPKYFSKCFKQSAGLSPSDYRNTFKKG